MRVLTIVLPLLAVMVAGACEHSRDVAPTGKSSSVATKQEPQGGTTKQESQEGMIYAAVIRQLVVKDNGFGSAPSPYRHVYVLDGVAPRAGDPMRVTDRARTPFEEAPTRQISARLGDVQPLTFAPSRSLIVTGSAPGHIVNRGVLITLGRVKRVNAKTALVPNNRWAAGDNGQWLTYIVKYEHASWRVTGSVGNIAIS